MGFVTLTITPGRTGSKYLADVLRNSFGKCARITHERIGPWHSLPRVFFHAYEGERRRQMVEHPPITRLMQEVKSELARGPVIEIGMFSSHLFPAFLQHFGQQLRLLVLFRHPLLVAASHSLRGTYDPWCRSFYRAGHLTPFDVGMHYKAFGDRWVAMSPIEKNLYRCLEYMRLHHEVQERSPEVPALFVRSEDLFRDPASWLAKIAGFAGLDGPIRTDGARKNEGKNVLTYPVGETWRNYSRHPEIIEAAREMGYAFDDDVLASKMAAYQLPDKVSIHLLSRLGWYRARSYLARRLRRKFWRKVRRGRLYRKQYPEYAYFM